MILKEENNQEIIIGGGKQQAFSIDDSSSMIFDILRNKLYSNKIGAIAREIASNSRDANREANMDEPIEIEFTNDNFLSNIGDTSIIFRDFGFGISPDRMENIFLKYGASSKRDSNLQTGGFGLGAKVPMAYTDSFVIKTRNNNTEYIYNAIIDSTGKGKMITLSEEFTDQPSGTEIIIPILSNSDRISFENEVYKYTMHWNKVEYINFKTPKPNVQYILETPEFRITNWKDAHFVGLLDGIPYEIKPEGIVGINNYTVLVNLDLDAVTINANRESLQYDEQTKGHVNLKIKEFKNSLQDIISDYLSDNNTFLEAYSKFKHISHTSHTTNDIENLICNLKSSSSYGFDYKVVFDGEEVSKISLSSHGLIHVKKGTNGFKYTGSSFTMDYPIVYLDKGGIKVPKNEKLVEFLLIKPDKSISKDILEAERKKLEDYGIEIINYSDVKPDTNYVKPVRSEKVRLFLRGGSFRNDKMQKIFDKGTNLIDGILPTEAVFKVVDDFRSYYGYSSINQDKYAIFQHETGIKKFFHVSRVNWVKYLEPNGYQEVNAELEKINYKKYSKYVEAANIKNMLSKFPKIVMENFPELLPKSVLKLKDDVSSKPPKGLEYVNFGRLGFEATKFNYDGVIKKFKNKLDLNYPMLRPYLNCNHDEATKINNIKKYLTLK